MNGISHFGSNESSVYYITIISTVLVGALLIKFFKTFFKERGNSEGADGGETNYAHIYLLISASFFFL